MGVHPTARVDPAAIVAGGAELGPDVQIGPWCYVGPRVRIEARTRLIAQVVVDGDTTIGPDCEIYPFATLGIRPQDKKLLAGDVSGRLRIGAHNVIRESVTLHGGTPHGSGTTTIGDHNMFLVGCHVGHDATIGSHVVFTNGAMAAGHTLVEDRAILGAMVGIHQFARVGKLAMIGAGAMVSRDAPPFGLLQGDRARLIGINVVGMRRAGMDGDRIGDVKRLFRMLFWHAGALADRLDRATEALGELPHARHVIEFVRASRRGVCMPRSRHAATDHGAEGS
jgi:UDP-N-acetylglucosamine acyltransferase